MLVIIVIHFSKLEKGETLLMNVRYRDDEVGLPNNEKLRATVRVLRPGPGPYLIGATLEMECKEPEALHGRRTDARSERNASATTTFTWFRNDVELRTELLKDDRLKVVVGGRVEICLLLQGKFFFEILGFSY